MDKHVDTSIYLTHIHNRLCADVQFDSVVCLFPHSLKFPSINTAGIYNLWGMLLLFSNEFSKSVKILQKAIILNPNLIEAQINLGNAFFRLGKENEALQAFKNALKISPSSYELHKALIRTLIELSRIEKLQEVYKETVADLPPDVNIGNLYSTAADVLI